MGQPGNIYVCRTDPTRDFTGSLATAAGENASIPLDPSVGAIHSARCRLRGLTIESVENLAWEIWLFGNKLFRTGAIGTERVLGFWAFTAADAKQIGGAGLYVYHIYGLDVPYIDQDGTAKLHTTLVNRSVGSKTAGAAGAIRVDYHLEPTGNW